jgi:hypothetical protein
MNATPGFISVIHVDNTFVVYSTSEPQERRIVSSGSPVSPEGSEWSGGAKVVYSRPEKIG